MIATLAGIMMLVRPVQLENEPDPIEVTLAGIVMLVRPVQFKNALCPMEETPAGIVKLPVLPAGHASSVCPSELSNKPATLV